MKGRDKAQTVDPSIIWFVVVALGIALLLTFMVTDMLGITSPDASTPYASLLEDR